jgi:superfamily I DNA/RNA helicase
MAHFLNTSGPAISAPDEDGIVQVGDFPPTEEQRAILLAGRDQTNNLLINALAGAAKTSTLVMLANQPKMKSISTLCLAFNKRIADELRSRLPSNCQPMTLNSLGHRTWQSHIGKRCRPSSRKNFEVLKAFIDDEPKNVQTKLWEEFSEIMKAMAFGKQYGWIPDRYPKEPFWRGIDDESFLSQGLPERLAYPESEALVKTAYSKCLDLAFEGEIDFDEQLLMPTCFGARFPNYPLTMIDESQDLSALNHEMLARIVGSKRLIAVGDPCQAIYGFRGAHADSMELLKKRFEMEELTLTTTFRCPINIVKEAQWRAPSMKWASWAKPGTVLRPTEWDAESLPTDAVVLCRYNAPLYRTAIRLLIDGRYGQIVGNDIGKGLIKQMQKIGPKDLPVADAYKRCDDLERQRLSRAQEHGRAAIKDQFNCIRIFLEHGDTLGAAIAYAEHLMTMTGSIKLMTGHKSKGLEFKHVYLLDADKIRIDLENPHDQEANVLYVMQTRAIDTLSYVRTDTFKQVNVGSVDEA